MKREDPYVRVMRRAEPQPNGCLDFMGSRLPAGYGRVGDRDRLLLAHRVTYEHRYGPVPPGLDVHHECQNTSCVNPDHLRAVTRGENNAYRPGWSRLGIGKFKRVAA